MSEKNKEIEIFERLSKVEAKIDTLIEQVKSLKSGMEKISEKYNDEIGEIYNELSEQGRQINALNGLKKWVETMSVTMVSLLGVIIVYLVKLMLKV
jgi:DNA anti-recombination protein RmuC